MTIRHLECAAVLAASVVLLAPSRASAASCESLAMLALPNTTITLITAHNTINYYESVRTTLGAQQADSAVRLFMAPGMNHCGGGPGPNTADWLAVLERWVEQKQAPNEIVASHSRNGAVDRTRPLCPYPQVAQYKGSGSTDEAANFVCTTP